MQALLRFSAFCHPVHTWSSLSRWPCFLSIMSSIQPTSCWRNHASPSEFDMHKFIHHFCHFYFIFIFVSYTIAFPLNEGKNIAVIEQFTYAPRGRKFAIWHSSFFSFFSFFYFFFFSRPSAIVLYLLMLVYM